MKKDEQSGFILMIVIMVAIVILIVGFAVYRIMQANTEDEPANISSGYSLVEVHESPRV